MTTTRLDRPGTLPFGAACGIWIGCTAWLLALVAVAADHLDALLWPVLGGAAVSVGVALAVTRLVRRAGRGPVLVFGTVAGVGVLLLYYATSLQPAIAGLPTVVDRMHRLGSVTEVPVWVGTVAIAVGGVGAVAAHWRP